MNINGNKHSSDEYKIQNGHHNNNNINNNNINKNDDNNEYSHESLSEFCLRLCKIHKDDIYELSRENGYSLNDKNKFYFWNLRSSLMKLVQIPSDSKLIELLSLRLNSINNKNNNNNNNINEQLQQQIYSKQIYYYLNIQINTNECIHVRIYENNGNRNVQAILYKKK
eukprot:61069_1